MPREPNTQEERQPRSSRSRSTGVPMGPAVAVLALLVVAYFGSQMIAESSAPPPAEEPTYVPFANYKDEAPPDPSTRQGKGRVDNAPAGLADRSVAFAAARSLAAQGEKALVDARAADASGDSAKARELRKLAHTTYDQAFTDTAIWEEEIVSKYTDRDRQVKKIMDERSRWMQKIIALHKTTGR